MKDNSVLAACDCLRAAEAAPQALRGLCWATKATRSALHMFAFRLQRSGFAIIMDREMVGLTQQSVLVLARGFDCPSDFAFASLQTCSRSLQLRTWTGCAGVAGLTSCTPTSGAFPCDVDDAGCATGECWPAGLDDAAQEFGVVSLPQCSRRTSFGKNEMPRDCNSWQAHSKTLRPGDMRSS